VPRYPYDILLAGIGMGGPAHTTLETLRLLRRARIVYTLSMHEAWLRRVCRRVVSLDDHYYTGEEDGRVYRRLADIVLEEARRGAGVAFVDDGHPLIYDDMCQDVLRRGQRRGLRVTALPAVSFLDTMVAQCGVPFGAEGLQVVEATTLVAARQILNPRFETLVAQLGWFGQSLLVEVRAHAPDRFDPLVAYLRRFYAPEQRVRILRIRQWPRDTDAVVACRLDRLGSQHRRIPTDATLHIPALLSPAEHDDAFVRSTTDRDQLARIARV